MATSITKQNRDHVKQRLTYDGDSLLDERGSPVMMGWELGIMRETAKLIGWKGAHVANIGFGMGLIDRELEKTKPASHHIIEPHPDVHAKIVRDGWVAKPHVTVHFDFWQKVVDDLPSFDGIYWDTWDDDVDQFRQLARRMPRLLRPGGAFAWFNYPEQKEMVDSVERVGLSIERYRIKVKPPKKSEQGTCYYFESRVRNYDVILGRRAAG